MDEPACSEKRVGTGSNRTLRAGWEHELFDQALKRQLRENDMLQSHTLETGAQEVAALRLAAPAQKPIVGRSGKIPSPLTHESSKGTRSSR